MITLPKPIFETNFENGSLIDKASNKTFFSGTPSLIKYGKMYGVKGTLSGTIPLFKSSQLYSIKSISHRTIRCLLQRNEWGAEMCKFILTVLYLY